MSNKKTKKQNTLCNNSLTMSDSVDSQNNDKY